MSNRSARPQARGSFIRGSYEKRDANAKWIFGIVAFLFVTGLLIHFCLAGVMERLERVPAPTDRWTGLRRDPGSTAEHRQVPHLQIAPPEDLKRFRQREDNELMTYGWINRTSGIVRIPIDRAMELVLRRGLPVWSGTNAGPGTSPYQLQQQRPPWSRQEDK